VSHRDDPQVEPLDAFETALVALVRSAHRNRQQREAQANGGMDGGATDSVHKEKPPIRAQNRGPR